MVEFYLFVGITIIGWCGFVSSPVLRTSCGSSFWPCSSSTFSTGLRFSNLPINMQFKRQNFFCFCVYKFWNFVLVLLVGGLFVFARRPRHIRIFPCVLPIITKFLYRLKSLFSHLYYVTFEFILVIMYYSFGAASSSLAAHIKSESSVLLSKGFTYEAIIFTIVFCHFWVLFW